MKTATHTVIDVPDVGQLWIVEELTAAVWKHAQASSVRRGRIWTIDEVKLLRDRRCPVQLAREIAKAKLDIDGTVAFTTSEPSLFDTAPRWKSNAGNGAVTVTTDAKTHKG